MKVGDVVKTNSITIHFDNLRGIQRETWKTRRGKRFVFLVLGYESQSDEKEFDPDQALRSMGWKKAAKRKK